MCKQYTENNTALADPPAAAATHCHRLADRDKDHRGNSYQK